MRAPAGIVRVARTPRSFETAPSRAPGTSKRSNGRDIATARSDAPVTIRNERARVFQSIIYRRLIA
jgi:hypothetical protein